MEKRCISRDLWNNSVNHILVPLWYFSYTSIWFWKSTSQSLWKAVNYKNHMFPVYITYLNKHAKCWLALDLGHVLNPSHESPGNVIHHLHNCRSCHFLHSFLWEQAEWQAGLPENNSFWFHVTHKSSSAEVWHWQEHWMCLVFGFFFFLYS